MSPDALADGVLDWMPGPVGDEAAAALRRLAALEAENARLHKALEWYAAMGDGSEWKAREALEERP